MRGGCLLAAEGSPHWGTCSFKDFLSFCCLVRLELHGISRWFSPFASEVRVDWFPNTHTHTYLAGGVGLPKRRGCWGHGSFGGASETKWNEVCAVPFLTILSAIFNVPGKLQALQHALRDWAYRALAPRESSDLTWAICFGQWTLAMRKILM